MPSINLVENYENIKQRICGACKRAGRAESEVTLIAVSKTKPISMLEDLYNHGVRHFGENKVQELSEKMDALANDTHWHMIGHLQRNKVKYIANSVSYIHSVESVRLAETISKEAVKHQRTIPILIEINAAGEESKFGIRPEETEAFIREISGLPGIKICGLMTVAPFVEDPEDNRTVFRQMKQLSVDIEAKNINNVSMRELSMGMTNDFEIAVEEGATFVRVGSAIFGERDYSI